MKKRILLTIVAVAAVAVGVAGMSAFEAHVINVTAKIENALSVDTTPIEFGTVFPQEQLDKFFDVALSDSFLDEERVDDVNYIIRQKPKCAVLGTDGSIIGDTISGHVDDNGVISCPEVIDPSGQVLPYEPLPLLCRFLSKHEITDDGSETENDGSLDAFHEIGTTTPSGWDWNDVTGRLTQIAQDISDTWKLDLKVPCFEGHCAQDWADYVDGINPDADPADYIEPTANEHAIYGCDIWVEVTGVSQTAD